MSNAYRAEQFICFSSSEAGPEIELKMVVKFKVHKGSPATQIDPAEPTIAEIDTVRFFEFQPNKPAKECHLPEWLIDQITGNEDFNDWLVSEAADIDLAAREDATDARREMLAEVRL